MEKGSTEPHVRMSDLIVRSHLVGKHAIGIYPLLPDETCWLLAIDFDKSGWHEDVLAALSACDEMDITASLERSRSGRKPEPDEADAALRMPVPKARSRANQLRVLIKSGRTLSEPEAAGKKTARSAPAASCWSRILRSGGEANAVIEILLGSRPACSASGAIHRSVWANPRRLLRSAAARHNTRSLAASRADRDCPSKPADAAFAAA